MAREMKDRKNPAEEIERNISQLQARLAEVKKELKESEDQLASAQKAVLDQKEVLHNLNAEHRRRNDENQKTLRDEIAFLKKEKAELEDDVDSFYTKLKDREIVAETKLAEAQKILEDVKKRELQAKDDMGAAAALLERSERAKADVIRIQKDIEETKEYNEGILANIAEREKSLKVKTNQLREEATRLGLKNVRRFQTIAGDINAVY